MAKKASKKRKVWHGDLSEFPPCSACGWTHTAEPWEWPECWKPWQEHLACVNKNGVDIGILKTCTVCDEKFYFLRFQRNIIKHKVCGPCKLARRRRTNAESMRRHRAEQRPEPEPCARCGESFNAPRSDARFCSSACRQAAYRERKVAT